MAALALESLKLPFFHFTSSPSPPLQFSTTSNLQNSNSAPKLLLKCSFLPLSFSISRNFKVCSSSSAVEEVSVENETDKEKKRRKLYVRNLPWTFSVADLKNLFSECGTVADVEMIKREDGMNRGIAFVTMSTGEEALAVIEKFDSHELMGRTIKVEFAKKFKKPSPPPPTGLRPSETRHKLYVSNLSWKVRSTHLREFFSADFNPVSARVVFENIASGRSAGYGFVSFASKEEAESAISAMDGKELLGRPVSLKFSVRTTDKTGIEEESTPDEQTVE